MSEPEFRYFNYSQWIARGKDGDQKVINELCYCGALKTQHQPSVYGAPGHGPSPLTGCYKFTWKEHVYEQ